MHRAVRAGKSELSAALSMFRVHDLKLNLEIGLLASRVGNDPENLPC